MCFIITPRLSRRHLVVIGLVACGLLALLVWLASGWWVTRPVEETVTTRPHAAIAHPVQAQAVSTPSPPAAQLAAPHPGIERAGDEIAAAIVHLREQRTPAALRSLNEARHTLRRVIEKEELQPASRAQLEALLRELDKAEQAIGHEPAPVAIRHLAALDDRLDQVE